VVTGAPGRGFQPIADDLLVETAREVLTVARGLIRSGNPQTVGRSLIMPLFGTGQGRLEPVKTTERLLREAIEDLADHAALSAKPDLTTVLFSAFTRDHVSLLDRLFESWVEQGELRRAEADPTNVRP
jgi:hypothetical protein